MSSQLRVYHHRERSDFQLNEDACLSLPREQTSVEPYGLMERVRNPLSILVCEHRWQVILDIADRSPSLIPPEIRQAPQILHSQQ